MRDAGVIADAVKSAAARAYRRGQDPAPEVWRLMKAAAPLLAKTMAAAHLKGMERAVLNTPQIKRRILRDTSRFRLARMWRPGGVIMLDRNSIDKLVETMAKKVGYSGDYLTQKYLPAASETMLRATQEVMLNVREAIEQAARERLHVNAGISLIRQAFEASGVQKANNYQLEALFRTGTGVAYGAGRWSKNQDPEIRDILWGYEFVTVGDSRVRPEHQELDGLKMPVTDPRWAQVWPPVPSSPWNCRCDTVEIFTDQSEQAVLVVPDGAFENLIGSASPFGSALQWAG